MVCVEKSDLYRSPLVDLNDELGGSRFRFADTIGVSIILALFGIRQH